MTKNPLTWLSSIPKILKSGRYTEVAAFHKLNDGLQIISLLPSHADLAILQLALHFEILTFDRLNNFLGLIAFQTLLNLQLLPGMPQRRNRRLNLLYIAQIDAALRKSADPHAAD